MCGWGGCKVIFISKPTTVEVVLRLCRVEVGVLIIFTPLVGFENIWWKLGSIDSISQIFKSFLSSEIMTPAFAINLGNYLQS